MYAVDFELTGATPILMHRDNVEASDLLSEWRSAPENKNLSVAGDDRSPPWTWQTYLYEDGERLILPSECLMRCLRSAGAQITMKGKKGKTFKEVSQSGMVVPTENMEFLNDGHPVLMVDVNRLRGLPFKEQADGARDLGFRLFVKRARIGQAKHVRVRARFDKWVVRGTMNVFVPEITMEVLDTMFVLAGRIGLLDWRPGSKSPGPWGMYTTTLKMRK